MFNCAWIDFQHSGESSRAFATLHLQQLHDDGHNKDDKRHHHWKCKALLDGLSLGIDTHCRRYGTSAQKPYGGIDRKYTPMQCLSRFGKNNAHDGRCKGTIRKTGNDNQKDGSGL